MSEPDTTMTIPLRAVINRIVGGGTPSRAVDAYWGGDIPWASVKDFSDSKPVIHDTQEHITEKGLSNSAANLIEPQTILICTRMAVGRAAICTRHIAINQDVKALYPSEELEAEYLLLLLKQQRPFLESMAIGSTVKGLSTDQLLDLRVSIPSKTEQTRIATVLSCIDRVIEQTEALIAKQQRIKTGLMQDLLTKGIDEHGNIRSESTHEFKDSPLGRIPKEWTVSILGDQFTLQRGFDITQDQQRPGAVPVVSSSGITSYHDRAMVSGPGAVIGRKGKLGQAYYLDEPFWPHDTTLWVKDFHGNSPRFATLYLESLKLERFDAATSVPTLNRNFVHPLIIAVPQFNEQILIADAIDSFSFSLKKYQKHLFKLNRLKTGLMQDLLTGTVSVESLLAEHTAISA